MDILTPPTRDLTRAAAEFVIDAVVAQVEAHDGDVKRAMVFLAIQHANVEFLSRDADLNRAYARDVPPDLLRRPISVHALAASLAMSPETTRRHVAALIEQDACVRTATGVIASCEGLAQARHAAAARRTRDAFRTLLAALAVSGANVSVSRMAGPQAAAPHSVVGRIMMAYVLRAMVDSGQKGRKDFTRRLIALAIRAANNRDVPYPLHADLPADEDQPPRPVSVIFLARRLAMPYETVRRAVAAMLAAGDCARSDGGVIIPRAVSLRPDERQAIWNNHLWFLRMLDQLKSVAAEYAAHGAEQAARAG